MLLATPLIYAAVAKIMAPAAFAAALPRLRIPLPQSRRGSWAVATLELTLAGTLLVMVRWESTATVALAYAAFAVIVERARRSGASGDCGCLGSLPSHIDAAAVIRNTGLALVATLFAVARWSGFFPAYDSSTALIGALSIFLAAAVLDTFLAVRRTTRSNTG